MNNIQRLYVKQGKNEEAQSMLEKIYSIELKIHGLEHVDTVSTMVTLAYTLLAQEKFEEAEKLFEQATKLSDTVQNIPSETRIQITEGLILAVSSREHRHTAETIALTSIAVPSPRLGAEAEPRSGCRIS